MWGVLIFHIANIAILCYICVNGVLNVGGAGWNFWKNGGNFRREEWKTDFCQKRGSTPPTGREEGHPAGQMGIRPGRWASGMSGSPEDGRRKTEGRTWKKLQSSASGHPGRWASGQTEGSRAGRASGSMAGRTSAHLFSIGNYFHSALLSESNINPKIII